MHLFTYDDRFFRLVTNSGSDISFSFDANFTQTFARWKTDIRV